ncbi:MAG: type II secretion system protein [bacterium]
MLKIFKLNNQSGFTLIEVLVAMGIFILLLSAVIFLYTFSIKSNKIVWEQLSTQNEGRKIVQDFINELRSANYSSIGAYPLALTSSTEIVFYSNIDSDTLRERVRYFMSGSTLRKGVIKPTGNPLQYSGDGEVLTDIVHDVFNTSTPVFYYYGENYGYTSSTPLEQPVSAMDVRIVGIVLELEEDPSASPVPFHIESKVAIRSLKDN